MRDHFGPIEADVVIGTDAIGPAVYTFATTWRTAYIVRAFGDTRFKCYFVQDFEPFFYAHGSEYVFAENTYRFGFVGVTAGGWLAERLRTDYGMRTFPLGFSYDKALYAGDNPLPKMNERPRVFFYARPPTPRRGFDLGILVLAEVVKRHPEVEIVMAGWELSAYSIPFRYVNMGALSLETLPDLFRSCDIALVLSYSNVSLLPLELMACGCSVVSNKGDHVEWLLNERVALLVESEVSAMANGICSLIENPATRMALQKAALDFCRSTDWEEEGLRLHSFLEQVRQESAAEPCYRPGCDT
jgi:glycosyltransferase involved in cell wall biosynthesis